MTHRRYRCPDREPCEAFTGGDGKTVYRDVCTYCGHHESCHEREAQ